MNKQSWMIILLLLMSTQAYAEHGFHINVHLASKHITSEKGLNEFNPGIGVEYKTLIAGFYHNSNYKQTLYLGKDFSINNYLGIKVAVVTGYEKAIMPGFGLYVRHSHIEMMMIPPGPKVPVTIALSLRF